VVAGDSAQEVARKRRDKAARLNLVAAAYEKGAEGERRTANALAMLPASGWFVLHDVRWPGKRFANIDHVVVGPGGVFVIDSKAWRGKVEVRDGVLRQNGYKREEAVASAADAAVAVAEQVPGLDPRVAKPVLCFVGDHELEGWARDVMLCTPANLVAMLMSRQQVLDAPAVRRTLLGLQETLKSATAAPLSGLRRTPSAAARATTTRLPKPLGAARAVVRLLGFLIFVALTFVGLRELPRLTTPLSRLFTPGVAAAPVDSAHARPLGSDQSVSAAAHRPPLRVAASQAITAHRVGTLPYLLDDNRFFAVQLTITNVGKRTWVSQPGTTMQVIDSYNVAHTSQGAVRIREGRVLPDTLRVAPGRTVRGYVVFQVSRTIPITGFSLTVGPGKPDTTTWKIDRK
jgi:hypothetical protein